MKDLEQKYVVACIDGSELTDAIVDYSAWIAAKVNSPLELLHSIEHGLLLENTNHSGNLTPNLRENLMEVLSEEERSERKRLVEQGKKMLEKAKSRVDDQVLKDVTIKQRHGSLAETLTDVESTIRVLVLGLRGEDHADSKDELGAQLESSIRALHRPIFVVSSAFKQPTSMMLAYNVSRGAAKALEMITKSPLYRDLDIHLVHVTDHIEQGTNLLADAESQLLEAGLKCQTALLSGDPQTELLAYQERHKLDMTVMGAFSHGKLRSMFFGSFTLKMLQQNAKPVLLIR